MPEIPHVRLSLSNRAENVLLVRQALSGLAETVGLDPIALNDISTAVSEACNNVVLHAYGGEEGPLEIEVYASAEGLEVLVRDSGGGIHPREQQAEDVIGGIGLPVIRALSSSVEFRSLDGAGTEVRMRFAAANARALEPERGEQAVSPHAIPREQLAATTEIVVGPAPLARAVLPRVLCALAARSYFSTDRISDTQLLADAIATHVQDSINGSRLSVQITAHPRDLQLRIGPLRPGRAETVLESASVGGVGSVLERLADGHQVSREGSSEVLGLRLAERS